MKRTKQAYIPSKTELEGLLALAKTDGRHGLRNWTMLHLSYFAGLRAKEIAMLNIEDLYKGKELKTSTFLDASQTKGSQPRRITLVDAKLRSALNEFLLVENLLVSRRSIFVNQSGARFTANGVVKLFESMYKNVELPCSSHSGRRYFATKLGNTPGITTKQMMSLGGWSNPEVAMQYVETNEEQLDDLVRKSAL